MTDLASTTPPAAAPASTPPPDAHARDTRKTPERPCLNCGDPVVGNYCPTCGQRKVEVRVSLRRMLMEALEDQFSINSALPRTVGALFFRPGHLTAEYVAGRIARYIPPFRLYLVSSLVFFVFLSLSPALGRSRDAPGTIRIVDTRAEPGGSGGAAPAAARPEEPVDAWVDSLSAGIHTGNGRVDALLAERLQRFRGMSQDQAVRRVLGEFLEHAPTMVFLLLPVFAAVIKLLYLRRRRYYVEHFVFALHVHAFVFLTFTASRLTGMGALEAAWSLWAMVYIYLAMKRFYGQGWLKTGVKYVVLGVSYQLILAAAFAVTFVVSLMAL